MPNRTVFFVSDGTGITAETFGNSILAQFPTRAAPRAPALHRHRSTRRIRWCCEINQAAEREGKRPIVFITLVNDEVRDIVTARACKGLVLDMFRTFVEPLEAEFGVKSNHRIGRFSDVAKSQEYTRPHRGHQLLAGARRRPVGAQPGQRRRDPGRRQPQRQDADLAVPGDAARHQGGQLPADPRGLRARQAAAGAGAAQDASASA